MSIFDRYRALDLDQAIKLDEIVDVVRVLGEMSEKVACVNLLDLVGELDKYNNRSFHVMTMDMSDRKYRVPDIMIRAFLEKDPHPFVPDMLVVLEGSADAKKCPSVSEDLWESQAKADQKRVVEIEREHKALQQMAQALKP